MTCLNALYHQIDLVVTCCQDSILSIPFLFCCPSSHRCSSRLYKFCLQNTCEGQTVGFSALYHLIKTRPPTVTDWSPIETGAWHLWLLSFLFTPTYLLLFIKSWVGYTRFTMVDCQSGWGPLLLRAFFFCCSHPLIPFFLASPKS